MQRQWIVSREYLMYYRGPGFLVVERFGSSPTPSSTLSQSSCVLRVDFTDGSEGGRKGRGMETKIMAARKHGPL
jgi:hypothetical protein